MPDVRRKLRIPNDELNALAMRAKEDDSLLGYLLESISGILINLADRVEVRGYSQEDLFHELKSHVLLKILPNYDDSRSNFSGHVQVACKQKIKVMHHFKNCKGRWNEDYMLEFENFMSPEIPPMYPKDRLIELWPFDGLTVREATAMEMYYLHELSTKHISRVFGCSQTTIYSYMRDAVIKSKRYLRSIGEIVV